MGSGSRRDLYSRSLPTGRGNTHLVSLLNLRVIPLRQKKTTRTSRTPSLSLTASKEPSPPRDRPTTNLARSSSMIFTTCLMGIGQPRQTDQFDRSKKPDSAPSETKILSHLLIGTRTTRCTHTTPVPINIGSKLAIRMVKGRHRPKHILHLRNPGPPHRRKSRNTLNKAGHICVLGFYHPDTEPIRAMHLDPVKSLLRHQRLSPPFPSRQSCWQVNYLL